MSVPRRLARLGRLVEARVEREGIRGSLAMKGAHWLCADAGGRRLWIVPALRKRVQLEAVSRRTGVEDVFRAWSQFDASEAHAGTVELGAPEYVGRVALVAYASDKWERKVHEYEHIFENPPRLTRLGQVYRIAGGRLRVTPAGVTG